MIMDPKLENEKGDYYLHLKNIIISKGYFFGGQIVIAGDLEGKTE